MKKKILSGILALGMVMSTLVVPAFADGPIATTPAPALVSEYDTLISEHKCEETAISTNLTIEDGAPDGTKYITTGDAGNNKHGEYCFQTEFSYGSNTKSDIMFALDIRFNADGSGLCVEDNGDAKVAGAVKNNGGKLAIQSASSSYTTTSVVIDTEAWYHIAMVGRYSASDANVDMYVWKYNSDGSMVYLLKQASIPLRNLSSSNNNGASHINILANTSVDNLRVYSLGADTLVLDSNGDSIKAGESMLFTYSASRAGEYITNPAVTWEVYNEADDTVLDDENITVSESGLLTIGGNASAQNINVRATAESGVYASKAVTVKAVDTTGDTYDHVELSADSTTVRAGSPLTITAVTTKDGVAVTPGEGDLLWKIYNAGNLRETGNKNITITDGVLSVNEDVVPQTVTVKAVNKSGSVSGAYEVQVLPTNMNYGNEDIYSDTFESADACEEYVSGATLEEGSWDGSGYYDITAAYDFIGFAADTNADVIYSADMRFAKDGAGWTVFNSNKGKLGLQLSSSGTVLNAIGASNKATKLMDIDKDAWYNIQVMCATGNSSSGTSYARFIAYKYDENGNKVNPKTGEEGVPFVSTDINLRNLNESTANHININAGTHVDNIMNMYVAPDALTISIDAETILAGGSAQATTTASRKGVDFPFLSSALIKYEIYDADNKYPLGDSRITVDPNGKITTDALATTQDVYVRVTSKSGGMNDSKLLKIVSSDIFEVTSAGFNEDYSELVRIEFNKNLDYSDDVSFISAIYGADGAMKTVMFKRAYGDKLALGANRLAMNMAVPSDFDKVNDKLNVFAVTKLPVSKAVEPDKTVTASKSANGITITTPEFDDKTSVIILVLKTDDPTKVNQSDIAYFNQVSADSVPSEIRINGDYSGDYIVEVAGMINGIHTIKAASTAE